MYVIVDLAVVYLLPPGLKWSGSQCYVALYIILSGPATRLATLYPAVVVSLELEVAGYWDGGRVL